MNQTIDEFFHIKNSEQQWRSIYTLGGLANIIALLGILLDVVIGNVTGGNLSALPQTAIDRFTEFHDNKFLGLYHLDLLNIIVQMILFLGFFIPNIANLIMSIVMLKGKVFSKINSRIGIIGSAYSCPHLS